MIGKMDASDVLMFLALLILSFLCIVVLIAVPLIGLIYMGTLFFMWSSYILAVFHVDIPEEIMKAIRGENA